jgi:hypothetical protein
VSQAFDEFLAVASALLQAADNQTDLASAEAFYRRSISTAYYALFHRITEDVAGLVVGHLEAHRQTVFRRSIAHRAFKGLRKDLADQHQEAEQAGLSERQIILDQLKALCADLLQLQESRESADYAPHLDAPSTTAEEALRCSAVALQTWAALPESAKALFAQSLLWHLALNQRLKAS